MEKKDDVRAYVIKRQITKDGKKPYFKSPKIQRLVRTLRCGNPLSLPFRVVDLQVTPQRLQRRRHETVIKRKRNEKSRKEAELYNALLAQRYKDAKTKRAAVLQKKRSLSAKAAPKAAAKAEAKKA